uniref:DUF1761 domain-containing protein n=1 Tax=Phenylobacterium sp. TaxID=1871053 RepID=UPI00398301B6
QAVGLTVDMSSRAQTHSMILGVVVTLVMVLGIAWLIQRLGVTGLQGGVMTGLTAWFFFSLTTQALEYVYMGFTPTMMAINVGYQLVSFVLAGAALTMVKFGQSADTAVAA